MSAVAVNGSNRDSSELGIIYEFKSSMKIHIVALRREWRGTHSWSTPSHLRILCRVCDVHSPKGE